MVTSILTQILGFECFASLNRDSMLLFATKAVRMFSYGAAGVVLALYFHEVGLPDERIGLLLACTLYGDAVLSVFVTLYADRLGRRRMLLLGCALKVLSVATFAYVHGPQFWLLLAGATVGVISPSGNEVGPFMALEQSILSDVVLPLHRTSLFAWYSLLGYMSTALGSLSTGFLMTWVSVHYPQLPQLDGYRIVFVEYGAWACVLAVLVLLLSKATEAKAYTAFKAALTSANATPSGTSAGQRQAAANTSDVTSQGVPPHQEAISGRSTVLLTHDHSADNSEHAALTQPLLATAADDTQEADGPSVAGEHSMLCMHEEAAESSQATNDVAVAVAQAPGGSSNEAPAPKPAVVQSPVQTSILVLSSSSLKRVAQLSMLFAADAFAGGMLTGTLIAYYFNITYAVSNEYLGGILFGANIIAGISSLFSGWLAGKFGLINTMVFTHLPSNVLTILVPLMPNLELATAMLFLRFSISQMDVAPRQSYVSGIVPAHDRTATMGITNIVKSLGAACGPLVTGYLAAQQKFSWAFFLCGTIKILYDLALLWSFRSLKADHERPTRAS